MHPARSASQSLTLQRQTAQHQQATAGLTTNANKHNESWDERVENDVKYFVDGLSRIGCLKSDPSEFAKKIYQKADVK